MSKADPDFFLREGDHGGAIPGVLTDDDGVAIDIEGASVRFLMANILTTKRIAAAANNDQVDAATKGHVSYTWQAGDSDEPGMYNASWEVTYNDGSVETFPNPGYIKVRVTAKVPAPLP